MGNKKHRKGVRKLLNYIVIDNINNKKTKAPNR